jgi:tRNA pseudouridine38-40 synthase
MSFDIIKSGEEIQFVVTGNGFLHHMVRIMVGTLVEIGLGERPVDSIPALYGKERASAGVTLPACGLCLMEVNY